MLSEGHAYANRYPLTVVWSEARIVRQRQARRVRRDAVLMQAVISTLFSKTAGKELQGTLRRMNESD